MNEKWMLDGSLVFSDILYSKQRELVEHMQETGKIMC